MHSQHFNIYSPHYHHCIWTAYPSTFTLDYCHTTWTAYTFRESYSGHLKTVRKNVLITLQALYRHSPNTWYRVTRAGAESSLAVRQPNRPHRRSRLLIQSAHPPQNARAPQKTLSKPTPGPRKILAQAHAGAAETLPKPTHGPEKMPRLSPSRGPTTA